MPEYVSLIFPVQALPTCCARRCASAGSLEDAVEQELCREDRLSPPLGLFVCLSCCLFVCLYRRLVVCLLGGGAVPQEQIVSLSRFLCLFV